MNNDIQVNGQLGIKSAEELSSSSEKAENLIPQYTVQQQMFPKTGEADQLFFWSFVGVILIFLSVLLKRKIDSLNDVDE